MHMQADGVPSLFGLEHAGGQDVTRHCLDDVLDQLAAIGLNDLPLLGVLIDAIIDDRALTKARVRIAEVAPARQLNAQPGVGVCDAQVAHDVPLTRLSDCVLDGAFQHIPELDDVLVRFAPCVHDVAHLLFRQEHAVERSHAAERPDAALVAQGQLLHLADLALVLRDVLGLLVEGLGVGQLVQVRPDAIVELPKRFGLPVLAGEPREHAPLDVGQVRDDQLAPFRRDQGATHRARAQLGHVVEHQILAV